MSHKPSGRRYRRYIATAYARLLTQCESPGFQDLDEKKERRWCLTERQETQT
ncbi:MAG TPA: hypothetical protein VJ417_02425 [Candidatus Glassbacteria bacterium]|nr:hypothetical protein [Candidatus Glassbacteria bacterium]